MATFKVHVQRYVEETATIMVEADDMEAAIEEANDRAREDESVQWTPGDDIIDGAAMEADGDPAYHAVKVDAAGNIMDEWERT